MLFKLYGKKWRGSIIMQNYFKRYETLVYETSIY